MLRKLILVGVIAGSSASVPVLYQANPEAFFRFVEHAVSRQASTETAAQQELVVAVAQPQPVQKLGRRILLDADSRGHFIAAFKFNGRPVEAMIDTGATMISLNVSTARRIGISMQPSDFDRKVNTANGIAKAAVIKVDQVQIGRITVNNVQALVLEDKALQSTLVGMSFLQQLDKYSVENGKMILAQ